eukprot:sb/3474691/
MRSWRLDELFEFLHNVNQTHFKIVQESFPSKRYHLSFATSQSDPDFLEYSGKVNPKLVKKWLSYGQNRLRFSRNGSFFTAYRIPQCKKWKNFIFFTLFCTQYTTPPVFIELPKRVNLYRLPNPTVQKLGELLLY